jgi:DNA repair exonuclease SbcCD ATPase subunit
MKETDKHAKDRDFMVGSAQEEIRQKDKKIKDLERQIETLRGSALETEKESLQATSLHQKEIQKMKEQYNEKINQMTTKITQNEADLRKKSDELQSVSTELKHLHASHKVTQEKLAKEHLEKEQLLQRIEQSSEEIRSVDALKQKIQSLEASYKEEQLLRKKYFNMLEELKGNIRVYCRIRPLSNDEKKSGQTLEISATDRYGLEVHAKNGLKQFEYLYT